MNDEITVHVIKRKNRDNFSMRYLDPDSGKHVERSTGTTKRKEAGKIAAKWEAELQEGRYQKPSRWPWAEFRRQYDIDVLTGMKPGTAKTYDSTLNMFEKLTKPQRLADVTTGRVKAFVSALRERGNSPATIHHHLRHLKAVLRWALRHEYLRKLPTFEMPKVPKGMKGRPITTEEFERMLAAVEKGLFPTPKAKRKPKALPAERRQPIVDSWKFFLRGLWASGLRLSESLALRWDDAPGAIVVELQGRRPLLRIPAEAEKGNTNRLLPMTPEFAELLASVPDDQRRGWVFTPLTNTGEPIARTRYAVGPKVSAIGQAAVAVTGQRQRDGEIVNEFASAHDLRRSFGFRWSRRVMPTLLRELMRHASIETTMQFYVGVNAEATADELWRVHENGLGGPLGGPTDFGIDEQLTETQEIS